MVVRALVLVTLLLVPQLLPSVSEVDEYNIPPAIVSCLKSQPDIDVSGDINPFYLRGDFNGDGTPDYAVLVKQKLSGLRGILICHAGGGPNRVIRLGAGKKFIWDPFVRMDAWHVESRPRLGRGPESPPVPELKGEVIWIDIKETASGIIYWTGSKYSWYQQAD